MEAFDPAAREIVATPDEVVEKKGDMKKIPYPGRLNIASERGVHGHFSGCAIKLFPISNFAEEKVNTWAAENPHNLIVDVKLGANHLAIFYTRALTDEEISEFNEINREAARLITERREAEAELLFKQEEDMKAKNKEAREKFAHEEKERNRLMELGRVHESHCKKAKK